jgi:high-affinity Fe2+/Pb2+ permease
VEVVLFLTGIYSDYPNMNLISLGILVGLVILVIAVKVANYQIKKLPVKQIFMYSRWLFTALAAYFLYSGIGELAEHGLGF